MSEFGGLRKQENTGHRGKTHLGSAILWLLTFPGESSPNFPCIALGYRIESNVICCLAWPPCRLQRYDRCWVVSESNAMATLCRLPQHPVNGHGEQMRGKNASLPDTGRYVVPVAVYSHPLFSRSNWLRLAYTLSVADTTF